MRAGYVQFSPEFGKKEENLERIRELVPKVKAELLVLPELCSTGYAFRSKKEVYELSEEIPDGQTTRFLMNLAKDKNAHLVAGIAERSGGKFYNSAVLVSPEGKVEVYRKAHLFFKEKKFFSKGNTPFRVHDTGKARIGIMVCFDWAFPEVVRILAMKGADVICQPANLVLPYCQTAMLGAAIQNRVFIITANRTGVERGLRFTGMSQIVSPTMEVLARSNKTAEEAKVVEIDVREARNKRITKLNDVFKDRRVDLFGAICKRKS